MQIYNVKKLHLQENICELFAENKKQKYCGNIVLVSPVVLYIVLSTWPTSCHVFVKWPVGQKQLEHARLHIWLHFL